MNNFVFVDNVFRRDLKNKYIKGFTDSHLLVLVYMQRFTVINRNEINFCLGWLFDDFNIAKSDTRKEVINCFFDLVDWKLIVLVSDIDRDKFNRNTRINAYAVSYEDNFTMIYDSEVDKIFNADVDFRVKKTMLFLYCNIASRIDSKMYSYPSYESLRKDLNTPSDNRIVSALSLMSEYDLIRYDNVGQILVGNQVQQGNNIYVLCVDEDYEKHLKQGLLNRRKQYEEGKATIHKGITSDDKRSTKQRLNYLWKKFDDEDITDDELVTLKKLEGKYYEYNKLNQELIDDINFRLFDIPIKEEPKEVSTFDLPKKQKQSKPDTPDDYDKLIADLFG